ncbi:Spy/CpxP family protein refolding chaperone [bacterium]|nr:Spy/CpxP family protein refolding chaperone [bacterium]MBU1956839.1 Spy/CpxP family protein refolding chaperone [bacterium]
MTTLKILTKTLSIVTIAGIVGLTAAHAQPTNGEGYGKCHEKKGMMQHYKGKHENMRAIFKQLNLTDEQKTALKENRKAQREAMKAKRAEMKGSHNKGQFISVDGVDRAGMIAQATQRATARANMRADMMEKTLSILTPEQKTKFVKLLKADNN